MVDMYLRMAGYWNIVMISPPWSPHTFPSLALYKCSRKLLTTDHHSYPHPPSPLPSNPYSTDVDMVQPSLLGDNHAPLAAPRHPPVALSKQIEIPRPSSISLSISSFFHVDRCPRSYTWWPAADGFYNVPSSRVLQEEMTGLFSYVYLFGCACFDVMNQCLWCLILMLMLDVLFFYMCIQ